MDAYRLVERLGQLDRRLEKAQGALGSVEVGVRRPLIAPRTVDLTISLPGGEVVDHLCGLVAVGGAEEGAQGRVYLTASERRPALIVPFLFLLVSFLHRPHLIILHLRDLGCNPKPADGGGAPLTTPTTSTGARSRREAAAAVAVVVVVAASSAVPPQPG